MSWAGESIYNRVGEVVNAVLSDIVKAPSGKKITKIEFNYDSNGNLTTLKAYQGTELLFTLMFEYDSNQNLTSIVRS